MVAAFMAMGAVVLLRRSVVVVTSAAAMRYHVSVPVMLMHTPNVVP